MRELVPDEFANLLPEIITEEHLTGGEFLERVNKCRDGELISTLIRTQYITVSGQTYVESVIRINPISRAPISRQRERQEMDILKCEVKRLNHLLSEKETVVDEEIKIDHRLYSAINENHAGITQNDALFCSLLIAGHKTKNIAEKMNISSDSAFKLRKRIRHKLNLESSVDLFKYLTEIKAQYISITP